MSKSTRARAAEPTAHVDLEYPSSVPTFTVNPTQLSSSSTPLPWFSAFGRKDADAPLPSEIDPKYSDPAYYASASNYGKNGRNTSHTAKKPEGHIKRPPNCFLLFRSHVKESGIRIPDALKPIIKDRLREKRKEQKPNSASDEDSDDENDDDEQSVSKISGILWDFLPAAEKSFFRARAAHAKAMHKKLYPNYKYSPQVKDKTVKRRVGKKMAAEKRERLEEVAGVLVREMGWATEGEVKQRSQTPLPKPGTPALEAGPSTSTLGVALGETVFGVAGYAHQHPHSYSKTGSAPPPSSYNGHPTGFETSPMGVPMGATSLDPSAVYNGPRMERRTSSCPPPNAHLSWAEVPHTHTPPASTSYQQSQYHHPQTMFPPAAPHPWNTYAPPIPQPQTIYPPPPNGAYVRPGGKTIRKMRAGPTSAKSQLLNGKPGSSKKSHQRGASSSTAPSPAPPTLPSLPAALTNLVASTPSASDVPMTTGVYDATENGWSFQHQSTYYDQSQHSSPQTFSSSAPPSVLLETPPFHPQLQHPTYVAGPISASQQVYDPAFQTSQHLQQQPFGDYSIQPTQGAQGYTFVQSTPAPKAGDVDEQGELQLTIVDPNYTFPPLNPSPTGSPRSGSPPRAPSQREANNKRQFTRQHHHSPLGKQTMTVRDRKANRLNTASPERVQTSAGSPYTPSPAPPTSTTAPPPLISPTPITPISSMSLHQQAGQQAQSLDDLGVEFNLNMPAGGDPGAVEFHFHAGTVGGQNRGGGAGVGMFDGYGLLGGANPNVLLGDVALGMHEDGQNAQAYAAHFPTQSFGNAVHDAASALGPLGVPLDALYGSTEDAGPGPLLEQFDPSNYIADGQDESVVAPAVDLSTAVQDELPMTSAQQLEYDMMEWRRASEGQQGAQEGGPRRASVMLSQALGGEVGFALYGFDASNAAGPHQAHRAGGFEMGNDPAAGVDAPAFNMGFDFQNEIQFGNHHPTHPPAASASYCNVYGQGPLGTVEEERERASSEESDESKRLSRNTAGHWVASSA